MKIDRVNVFLYASKFGSSAQIQLEGMCLTRHRKEAVSSVPWKGEIRINDLVPLKDTEEVGDTSAHPKQEGSTRNDILYPCSAIADNMYFTVLLIDLQANDKQWRGLILQLLSSV